MSSLRLPGWMFLIAGGLSLLSGFGRTCEAAEITGRVEEARSGRPLPGTVHLQPGDLVAPCDAGGRFRITGLEPGPYTLTIQSRGHRDEVVEVDLAPEGRVLEIRLASLLVEEVTVLGTPELEPARVGLAGEEVRGTGKPDLGAILRDLPGVAAVRRGALGLDPVVRGLREDQVATFVDGGRTFPACPGRMDSGVSHVDPEAVEKVEVIKGPYALSWGAGTLSAVSVRTERPGRFDHPSMSGWMGAGGQTNTGARSGSMTLRAGTPRTGFLVSLTSRHGDDYRAGGGIPFPAEFGSDDLRLVGEWDVGETGLFAAEIGYLDQGRTDYAGRPMNERSLDNRDYGLRYTGRLGSRDSTGFRAEVRTSRSDHAMDNEGKPNSGQVRSVADTEVNTATGRVVFDWVRPDRWLLAAGVDGYVLNQDGRRLIRSADDGTLLFDDPIWAHARITDAGAFVRQTLFTGGRSDWTWSARLDAVRSASDEPSPEFSDATTGDLRQNEVNLSAALEWTDRIGEHWSLNAGLGRVVRTANATERYSNWFPSTRFQVSGDFLGGPDLDPEVSYQVDTGVRFGSPRWTWVLEPFYRVIDDIITVVPDPTIPKVHPGGLPVVYRYINGGRATYAGFETGIELRFGAGWTSRLQAEYVRAEDESLNEPVFGIPPLLAFAGLRYTRPGGRWFVEGRITAADRQDRVATSKYELETPGYTFYGLLVGVRFPEGVSLELRGENLTDRFIVDHLNSIDPFTGDRIPEPGRVVSLGVLWKF